jgi:hypothetical protein
VDDDLHAAVAVEVGEVEHPIALDDRERDVVERFVDRREHHRVGGARADVDQQHRGEIPRRSRAGGGLDGFEHHERLVVAVAVEVGDDQLFDRALRRVHGFVGECSFSEGLVGGGHVVVDHGDPARLEFPRLVEDRDGAVAEPWGLRGRHVDVDRRSDATVEARFDVGADRGRGFAGEVADRESGTGGDPGGDRCAARVARTLPSRLLPGTEREPSGGVGTADEQRNDRVGGSVRECRGGCDGRGGGRLRGGGRGRGRGRGGGAPWW